MPKFDIQWVRTDAYIAYGVEADTIEEAIEIVEEHLNEGTENELDTKQKYGSVDYVGAV